VEDLRSVDEGREAVASLGISHYEVPVEDLDFALVGDGKVAVRQGGELHPITRKWAYTQLHQQTGISRPVLEEYGDNPELFQGLVRHSLRKRGGKNVRVVADRDGLLEFQNPEHPWIAPDELYDTVVETVPNILGLKDIEITPRDLKMRFVTDINAEPPKRVGDVSHSGIVVSWDSKLAVAPYVLHLVCTNGMCREESVVQRVSDIREVREYLRNALTVGARDGERLLGQFIDLDNHVVAHPEQVINRLARTARLGDRHVRRLIESLPSLPDDATAYDFTDLLTSYARDNEDIRARLETGAGTMTASFTGTHRCSHCGTHLLRE
jgi:hypothetical protein